MCLLIYDVNACNNIPQPTFTCSMMLFPAKMYLFKSTIETVEKGAKCSKLTITTLEQGK